MLWAATPSKRSQVQRLTDLLLPAVEANVKDDGEFVQIAGAIASVGGWRLTD